MSVHTLGLVGLAMVATLWLEHRRPLRARAHPRGRRWARNLTIAATATVTQLIEAPVLRRVAAWSRRRRVGLLAGGRGPLEVWVGVVALDYGMYVWHVLLHRHPWLWCFHQVHHIDRDLDATTAARFHVGELIASTPFRAALVAALGISSRTIEIWRLAFAANVWFHHSNIRLPGAFERALSWLIVTPRLHGIHHSNVPEHLNTNWSSGLALWDWLHGTRCTEISQDRIVIGLPAYASDADVGIATVLLLPFAPQRPGWAAPVTA